MLLVLLLAVAVMLVLYFYHGGGEKSYVQQQVSARKHAEREVTAFDLSNVGKSMIVHAAGNDGKFPDTPEELSVEASLPRDFVYLPSKPSDDALTVYIPGQKDSMPGSNVLLYQSKPSPNGTIMVLCLDGRVLNLPPEQAQAAVDATTSQLAR
jgi:hypothetical protein